MTDEIMPLDSNATMPSPITHDSLKADYPELVTAITDEGIAQGMAVGHAQERLRIGSILNADETQGRESLANHFAFDTEMPAADVLAALAAAPKATAATHENSPGFEQVMATISNPDIAPAVDAEPVSEEAQMDQMAKRIAASTKR